MLVRYLYAAIICLFAACSTGTTKGKDEKPKILVSIAPQAAVAKVIAGDKFTVSTLLGRGSDPETFDPSASDRMDVDKADVYFVTGVLPRNLRKTQSLPIPRKVLHCSMAHMDMHTTQMSMGTAAKLPTHTTGRLWKASGRWHATWPQSFAVSIPSSLEILSNALPTTNIISTASTASFAISLKKPTKFLPSGIRL